MLPERVPEAEDAFVAGWSASDDTDGLVEAIEAAMGERRPQLAARLVQLLDEHVEIEPGSDLDRARKAASLFLLDKERPEDRSWSELEDAWRAARRRRMTRIKRRMRQSLEGRSRDLNRLGKPRRR